MFDVFEEILEVSMMQYSTKECDNDDKEQTITYCDLTSLGDYIEYDDGTVLIDKDYTHSL